MLAINAETKKEYTGKNQVSLLTAMETLGYESNQFATFNQWKKFNRGVVAGKSIELMRVIEKEERNENGLMVKRKGLKSFHVWNLADTYELNDYNE